MHHDLHPQCQRISWEAPSLNSWIPSSKGAPVRNKGTLLQNKGLGTIYVCLNSTNEFISNYSSLRKSDRQDISVYKRKNFNKIKITSIFLNRQKTWMVASQNNIQEWPMSVCRVLDFVSYQRNTTSKVKSPEKSNVSAAIKQLKMSSTAGGRVEGHAHFREQLATFLSS